ncbi:MAG: MarR family transcriptional regulator [Proteobacteria bacterium]|nr:MarR family transcriptional regulator [Pseudomonadota bacterium]
MKINPQQTVFYSIEHAIKEYRKFAQKNIASVVPDMTIDQILILTTLYSDPKISQKKMAQLLFKDYASITRMIELLVKKGYLIRKIHQFDRRKFQLLITQKGQSTLKKLKPIIFNNRIAALKGISDKQLKQLDITLNQIIDNCSNEELAK